MTLLDEVWDGCEKTRNFQPLIDICYGLNTSAKPYLKQPIENYNKIEDFINKAPDRFHAFMEKKSESELVVLFRKATMGVASDKEPLIGLQNGGYYFNNNLIGSSEGDAIYYLRTNPKIREYLENALNIRRSHDEMEKAERMLEEAFESTIDQVLEEEKDMTAEIIAHAERWVNKIIRSRNNEDKMKAHFEKIKTEVAGYKDVQNQIAFKDYFNAKARREELPKEISL